jgi:hypothetical protein
MIIVGYMVLSNRLIKMWFVQTARFNLTITFDLHASKWQCTVVGWEVHRLTIYSMRVTLL